MLCSKLSDHVRPQDTNIEETTKYMAIITSFVGYYVFPVSYFR